MGNWSARKRAGVGAFAVVGLWLVGFFVAGKPPRFAAPSADVVHYYATHHKQVLIAVILVAAGITLYLAVIAQLSLFLRGSGQRSLAPLVLLGGAASAGLFAVGDALYGVIGQAVQSPDADPALAKALYQLDQFAAVPMSWLNLLVVASVILAAHRGVFPRWSMWLSSLFGVLIALGGICVKASGAFAAGTGPIANLAFAASLIFLLEVGVLLWGAKDRQPS